MPSPSILLVDDDPKFLHFITEVLIGAGYDVHCTADPLRTVEMAEALKPDLVILDISMPGKDGFEIARDLRASSGVKAARILFLTAHRAATHIKSAKAAGGGAYLEKPVQSSRLLWMIKALLSDGPRRKAKVL